MSTAEDDLPTFVMKPLDLSVLNHLNADHPKPRHAEWINRGTNQRLRPTSIDLLLRTLQNDIASPSVVNLHRSSGLRVTFKSAEDRNAFARAFEIAKGRKEETSPYVVCYLFTARKPAQVAIAKLRKAGIPSRAISLLWRAGVFANRETRWLPGHTNLTVASAVAASGLAGTLLGFAAIAFPGIGAGIAGLFAATHFSALVTGGTLGAAGGAMAMVLTDPDVDDVADAYHARQADNEMLIVAVDTRQAEGLGRLAARIMAESDGKRWAL